MFKPIKVERLAITPKAEEIIEQACRTCYLSFHRYNPPESTKELIQKVIKKEHFSVLEHASATYKITGGSRVMTHELVRHRLMSPSQESQRYVCYADKPDRKKTRDFEFVTPPTIMMLSDGNEELLQEYYEMARNTHKLYEKLLEKGIPPEDARYILPNATTSGIVISANMREFRHMFYMRCHPRAAWEIRNMMNMIKEDLKIMCPNVFFDFPSGPLKEEDYENIIYT